MPVVAAMAAVLLGCATAGCGVLPEDHVAFPGALEDRNASHSPRNYILPVSLCSTSQEVDKPGLEARAVNPLVIDSAVNVGEYETVFRTIDRLIHVDNDLMSLPGFLPWKECQPSKVVSFPQYRGLLQRVSLLGLQDGEVLSVGRVDCPTTESLNIERWRVSYVLDPNDDFHCHNPIADDHIGADLQTRRYPWPMIGSELRGSCLGDPFGLFDRSGHMSGVFIGNIDGDLKLPQLVFGGPPQPIGGAPQCEREYSDHNRGQGNNIVVPCMNDVPYPPEQARQGGAVFVGGLYLFGVAMLFYNAFWRR